MNQQNKTTAENSEPESNEEQGQSNESGKLSRSLTVPFAIVIVLTILSGLVHGMLDGRWSLSDDLKKTGSQLQSIPDKCGDWSIVETRELDEDAAEMLKTYGSVVRVYRHKPTGSSVTVAILFGPRGPIAVHVPEICYSSVSTKQSGDRKVEKIIHSKTIDSFWSVQFMENQSLDPTLDVWYGWSDGGKWTASEHPRFWMTDNLYKLQIAGPIGTEDFQPCKDFLTTFLPELKSRIEQ